jgi:hypothetical protein
LRHAARSLLLCSQLSCPRVAQTIPLTPSASSELYYVICYIRGGQLRQPFFGTSRREKQSLNETKYFFPHLVTSSSHLSKVCFSWLFISFLNNILQNPTHCQPQELINSLNIISLHATSGSCDSVVRKPAVAIVCRTNKLIHTQIYKVRLESFKTTVIKHR